MYLENVSLNVSEPLELVYELRKDLDKRPEYIEEVQKISLDRSKINIGLKGNKGLYGSKEWWNNIDNGLIPTKSSVGIITRVYEAGQEKLGKINSFEYKNNEGLTFSEGIYLLDNKNIELFKVGHLVAIYYCLDELKSGNPKYIEEVLEVALSKQPI